MFERVYKVGVFKCVYKVGVFKHVYKCEEKFGAFMEVVNKFVRSIYKFTGKILSNGNTGVMLKLVKKAAGHMKCKYLTRGPFSHFSSWGLYPPY